jgi:hypothetical protein
MKHLFLALTCCLYLAQATAQTDAPSGTVTYYGASLNGNLTSSTPTADRIVQVKTDKGVARASIFDPETQQIIAVIRGKAVACFGEKGSTSMLIDSSFVLKIPEGDTYSFDAQTQILTAFDAENRKMYTWEYRFTAKDTAVIHTKYYIKGNIHSQTVFNKVKNYSSILNGTVYDVPLSEALSPHNSTQILFTRYFPNSKTQEIATTTVKKVGANDRFQTRYTTYDSTGTLVANQVKRKDIASKPNISISFSKYGQINYVKDEGMAYKNYTIRSDYDDSTGALTTRKFQYNEVLPYKIHYLSNKPDGFFRKETEYAEVSESDIEVTTNSVVCPLFSIGKEAKGRLTYISLAAQNQKWTHDACPAKPQYVVEGGYDGILPDGAWRIYFVDTLGKKTHLAVAANFKKGLPDGACYALDAAKDTLASAVYRNGDLVYDKFADAFLFKKNYIQYLADSLKKMQHARNLRNQPLIAQQHERYLADIKKDIHTKTLWQRDTIATKINVSDNYNKGEYLKIVLIKEQFAPDSNSLVRLRYYFPDAPNVPMSVVRYHKKTKAIDSMAVLYNYKGNLLQGLDIQNNILLESHVETDYYRNITYTSICLRNDSIRIKTTYTDETQKGIKSIRTDSLAYTPTLRKAFADKRTFGFYFRAVHLDFENNELAGIINVNKYQNFRLASIEHEQMSPIAVHQTTYYAAENKPLYTETYDHRRLIYDADGATIINTLGSNPQTWTGINKYTAEPSMIYTEYYKNGKREGTWKEAYIDMDAYSLTVYENDFPISAVEYDYKHKITQESHTIAANRLQTIHYNENQDTISIEIDSLSLNKDRETTETEHHLQAGKYYAQDSTGKRYLSASWQKISHSRFLLRTWYPSGAPQIVYAYMPTAKSLSHLLLHEDKPLNVDDRNLYNLETQGILVQHENGKLYIQGIDASNEIACEYDENGNIQSEQVEDGYSKAMRYPAANETASCHWESLPYQEGKIENGRRVGNWRGYFRNAKKQLQYQLNYDAEGNITGTVECYDTNGAHLATETYSDSKRNGLTTTYKNNQPDQIKLYKNGTLQQTQQLDSKGKVYSVETQQGTTQYTTVYHPNTQTPAHRTAKITNYVDFECDSVYNESGKLIKIIEKDGYISTQTSFDKGKTSITYALEYSSLKENQAAYLKAAATDGIDQNGHSNLTNNKYQDKNKLLSGLKAFKYLKLPAATLSNFEIPTNAIEEDYDPVYDYDGNNVFNYGNQPDSHQEYPYNLSFPSYSLSDNFGQTLVLAPIKSDHLIVSLAADSIAESSMYKPIDIQSPSYPSCGNARTISVAEAEFITLNKNKIITAIVSAGGGVSTTLRYPAALLHPINSPEDAAFVCNMSRFRMVKTFPNYYKQDHKTGSKAAQVQAFAQQQQQAYEKIFTETSLHSTQIYTIGNTNLDIIPTKFVLLNDTPRIADENEYARDGRTDFSYMRFPHHQTTDKQNTLLCDDFLQQKKFRTLCTDGYIRFAPALPKLVALKNVLIDNQEINASFSFDTKDFDTKAFATQCKTQHIDLIITEKESNKALHIKDLKPTTIYIAHFRYRK